MTKLRQGDVSLVINDTAVGAPCEGEEDVDELDCRRRIPPTSNYSNSRGFTALGGVFKISDFASEGFI